MCIFRQTLFLGAIYCLPCIIYYLRPYEFNEIESYIITPLGTNSTVNSRHISFVYVSRNSSRNLKQQFQSGL